MKVQTKKAREDVRKRKDKTAGQCHINVIAALERPRQGGTKFKASLVSMS